VPDITSDERIQQALRLRPAVQAAIEAYEKSGRMVDAALAYAAHGFPVFPLDVRSKRPISRRDRDPSGKHPKDIPGTGGVYKATTDPKQIRAWWRSNPNALIGLPMGAKTGFWTVDVDTSEDHADGVAEWKKIIAQYTVTSLRYDKRTEQRTYLSIPPFVTREHRTATGGPHLIFTWNAEQPIGCSSGELPDGIDIKGQGGYIAVPPSRRKDRSYSVHNDIDPVAAPQWLIDLILPDHSISTYNGPSSGETDLDELGDAMRFVPNDDLKWVDWTSHALAIFAATDGQGFELFDAFSKQSRKYDPEITKQRWGEIEGSPPDRTGAGKLFKIARENGWTPELRETEPTAAADESCFTADSARDEVRRIVRDFLEAVACPERKSNVWTAVYFDQRDPDWPIVSGLLLPTGIGKTRITIEELAGWMREVEIGGPVVYAVPQHKLSAEIIKQFAAPNIDARIFRGRSAADPDSPGKTMCLNLEAVAVAVKAHADITSSCCYKSKSKFCRFYTRCGYMRQQPEQDDRPDVWIVASDMLFHTQKVFGEPAAVIADESIWRKGLRGVEGEEHETRWLVAIDSLLSPPPEVLNADNKIEVRDRYRNALGEALQQQEKLGGVERQHLEAIAGDCDVAIRLEWDCLPKLGLEPGMSDAEAAALTLNLDEIRHGRRVIRIWEAARELLRHPEIAVSGRLTLKRQNGQRVVEWKGIAPISKQFNVPTLMLDATLPALPILRVYHPQAEVAADIKVPMPPHVHIKQVLHAATSSSKLQDETHLAELRRHILQRWIETGRQRTLVISQLYAEQWLKAKGLPDSIKVEHFNNIAGLDAYRDVRLLVLAGRTAPGPAAMEALAAALSGALPTIIPPTRGFSWYPSIKRGIKLLDGRGIETTSDQHPD
jgi:Bifunctional DNA primase/polymerase, N-terminal/Primase C terminal 2 (PriCT-2)